MVTEIVVYSHPAMVAALVGLISFTVIKSLIDMFQ